MSAMPENDPAVRLEVLAVRKPPKAKSIFRFEPPAYFSAGAGAGAGVNSSSMLRMGCSGTSSSFGTYTGVTFGWPSVPVTSHSNALLTGVSTRLTTPPSSGVLRSSSAVTRAFTFSARSTVPL